MKEDTTRPKGATSYKNTKMGVIPREELIKLETKGINQGLEYIQEIKSEKITPELILSIHEKSFGFIFDWAGKFRTEQVMIGMKEAPNFFDVPILIKKYCYDLEERFKNLPDKKDIDLFFRELVSFLSWLQHQFVVIHPFNDYNGRTVRLLTNMLLLRLDLPLIEIKIEEKADRDRYIESMQKADNFDYTLLEGIVYDALREALEKNI